MLDLAYRPQRAEKVLGQRMNDTLVLLNPTDGNYYTLDDVGSRIWELCDGRRTAAEVATTICAEYDAPAETVRADVLELLEDLTSEKLVISAA
jgi:hypothetical protein